MQGLGNDYVFVNCFEEEINNPASVAKTISDRHFGIGSDGLILIKPSLKADCFMDIYNSDGSRAYMCGNGIRCVAKYIYEQGIAKKEVLYIETLSGIKQVRLDIRDNQVNSSIVNMGRPNFDIRKILNSKLCGEFKYKNYINKPFTFTKKSYILSFISIGNPHTVIYVDDIKAIDVDKEGYEICNSDAYISSTNVEFVQIIGTNHIRVCVYERGSGRTLACGTGACAAAVCGMYLGRIGMSTDIDLDGGHLEVFWDRNSDNVFLKGEAVHVFDGYIDI